MDRKKRWKIVCLVLLALGLLYLHDQYHITTEEILPWQPENLLLAAVILVAGYAVKSTPVFVSIMIPQIHAGHLYSRDIALLINLFGLVVVTSVPHWIGKGLAAKQICKHHVCSIRAGVFRQFIAGQTTEAVILGTICGIGMAILRTTYERLRTT